MPTSYTIKATNRKDAVDAVAGKGDANSLKALIVRTVELAAATAAGSTVYFGTIPSNARLTGSSHVYWDDLSTAGAPTLDLGLGAVNANITDDPDAISNGHALATASSASAITGIENIGLPAWDFVNGQTSDPKGELEVYGTVADAAHSTTGTITLELYGYID